jgi:hypothetical protein
MKNLFWMILGSVLFMQCTTPKAKKQMAEIDRLAQRVDSCEPALKTVNIDSVKAYYADINMQLAAAKEATPADQSFEEAKFLGAYYDNSKTFKKITRGYASLVEEMEHTHIQLANLKHDVKHNLVADSNYLQFYNNEKRAVKGIVFETKNYVYWQERGTKKYLDMRFKVDSLIESYQSLR